MIEKPWAVTKRGEIVEILNENFRDIFVITVDQMTFRHSVHKDDVVERFETKDEANQFLRKRSQA